MKRLFFLFLFPTIIAYSQDTCLFKIGVLYNHSENLQYGDPEDDSTLLKHPGLIASTITDTFQIESLCTDNGVTVVVVFKPHDPFGEAYQIVFLNDNEPEVMRGVASGDKLFLRLIPFFKVRRSPGGLIRPILCDGVYLYVSQFTGTNIYKIDNNFKMGPDGG